MMYLSITFDYELFFGNNNGTYDEVLFQPTYELIDILEKKGISATFFADVCSIPASKKYNQVSYVDGFGRQLQYMRQRGQDVQLHLHPHWIYSRWEDGHWSFSSKGYRLHEFKLNGAFEQIICDGIHYLNETLKPVDPDYECVAYRAGGFSLQPHQKIIRALYDNGIRVDSSIAPWLATKSKENFYDYRHKLEKMNWRISDSAEWWEDSNTGKFLFEIPVATIDKSLLSFVFKRIFFPNSVKLNLGQKRGSYIAIPITAESKLQKYYKYVTDYNAISLDAYSAEHLYSQTKRLYKKTKCDDQVVSIIGHPKLVNEMYINNLSRYIDMIMNDSQFKFISIYGAYLMKENSNDT